MGWITRRMSTSGRMSAAGRCDSRARHRARRPRHLGGRKCRLPRLAVGLPVRPVVVEIMPVVLRGCVRAPLRTPRAQREACVALAAMQVPFETRDRRQVHRGPERPGAAQTRNPAASPAWSTASTAASRPRPDGISRRAMPAQGPAQGQGSPTRTSQRWRTRSTRASSSSTLLPSTNTLREVGETSTTRPSITSYGMRQKRFRSAPCWGRPGW